MVAGVWGMFSSVRRATRTNPTLEAKACISAHIRHARAYMDIRTHMHTHTHTHIRTHAHIRTFCRNFWQDLSAVDEDLRPGIWTYLHS